MMTPIMPEDLHIRRATVDAAAGVADVMNGVIAEGGLTIFDRPFSVEAERTFIAALGPRSALHVAAMRGRICGVQSIDLFASDAPAARAMRHVATMGTWISAEARGRGIGRLLAVESFRFARAHAYSKILIQVLGTNTRALRFYRGLGFRDIGVARAHVALGGHLHDEVYLELLLSPDAPTPSFT
jgi:RimJ/RimL family protein N-acetyltransferase